ncbi:MAG: DUF2975 domain-containing protein [Bacteroidales bacterium]|nr:DUF2975 domain-containing protein [Bacteroidales bacterium]
MEKAKTPVSIRIIFIMNEIIFWLFNLAALGAVVIAFLVFINHFGDDLQLQIKLPVAFNADLDGVLMRENSSVNVHLVDAYGEIQFVDTPLRIARVFMIPLLLAVGAMYFMLFIFRKFIWSVNRGVIFETKNIRRLRVLALSLLAFWVFWVVYDLLIMVFIASNLHFGTIDMINKTQSHATLLIFSLVLWALSHIFLKGLKLEEETSLTI